MRVATAVVVGAACALTSGGRELPTAPPPRAKPTDADWFPKPNSDPKAKWPENVAPDPPTTFPDLIAPTDKPWLAGSPNPMGEALAKACPRLHGTIALAIEPTDDTLRKLLKARLHQGVLEFQQHQRLINVIGSLPPAFIYHTCLLDIQSTAVELWAGQPKELIFWLEELVIAARVLERGTRRRVEIGTAPPAELNTVSRLRLKMEAELWKAKGAK